MEITAKMAREKIKNNDNRKKALSILKEWTMEDIKKMMGLGLDHCSLAYTCKNINGIYYDLEDEIKEWLIGLGYKFKWIDHEEHIYW